MRAAHDGTQTLSEVAYHEAGHAILATAFGLKISRVSVELDEAGVFTGFCDAEVGTGHGVGIELGAIAVAQMLAGIVAQRLVCGEANLANHKMAIVDIVRESSLNEQSYWREDALKANRFAFEAVSGRHEHMVAIVVRGWQTAQNYLLLHRNGLDFLAGELMKYRLLDGDQLQEKLGVAIDLDT